MTARRTIPDDADRSRPPLFSPAEWQKIVQALSLSPRQAEVVGCIVQGMSDNDIKSLLPIKHSTLRSHFEDIQSRITVKSRNEIPYRVFETFRRVVEKRPPQK